MSDYLMFRSRYQRSKGPKLLAMTVMTLAVCLAVWLIFFGQATGEKNGNIIRKIVLSMCGIVYLVRLGFTLFVFLKRRLSWIEAVPVSVLMSLILFGMIYIGGNKSFPLNIRDALGIILYLYGSYLNTVSELERHKWKSRTENRGCLYSGGLFKRVRHVNYTGDILLFTGFALITQDPRTLYIPLFMALNFILFLIPAKEAYLMDKYGKAFKDYCQVSKKLIPMLY